MAITELIKKIDEKFQPLYEKVKGGYFGVLSAIAGVISISIASILFYSVEPFTFFTHWISNLGGIVTNSGEYPNGAFIVFSIGLFIIAILAIPFVVNLASKMLSDEQRFPWLVHLAVLAGIATLIGIIGVALFDMKGQLYLHTYSSMLFFIGAALMMFLFSLAMLFNSKISWKQASVGLITSGVSLVFLLTFIPHLGPSGDIISILAAAGEELALTRFFEWMFLFSYFTWSIETGLFSLKFE